MTTFKSSITNFRKYQQFVKNECEMGRCSKEEAIDAILGKAIEILQSLKMPIDETEEEVLDKQAGEEAYQMYIYN